MKYQEVVVRNFAGHLRVQFRRLLRQSTLNTVARVRNKPVSSAPQAEQFDEATFALIKELREWLAVEEREIRQRKANYMPLFGMPPARKKRTPKATGPTLTLIERRAIAARQKVQQWKRKQKLAATKVALYTKKVRYYTKKGVVS